MQNNIKISVITGVYRPNEALFRKFLHSCLNQTLDGIQFILIFDDPDDIQSRKIVAEYQSLIDANQNVFTILENSKNLGIHSTQQYGIKNALGKYLVFFDNDDFFDDEYLETMYKYATAFDANVIKGYAITHYFGNIDLNFAFICKHEQIFNEDDWLYMYKKDFFIDYFYYSDMYTSDTALDRNINCKYIEKDMILQIPFYEGVFYHYIRHCNNTSTVSTSILNINDNTPEDLADQNRIHNRFIKDFQEEFGVVDNISTQLQNKLELDHYPNNYSFDQLKGL